MKTKFQRQVIRSKRLLKKLFSINLIKYLLLIFLLLLIAPIILFFVLRPAPSNEIKYGFTFSNKYAEQMELDWKEVYNHAVYEMHPESIRLIAYWDDIEAEKDVYNFDDIKHQLDIAKEQNIDVILSMGRKVPRYPECFEPTWWKETENEDLRDQELFEYLKIATNELKDYDNIKIWQVENEPFWPFGECKEIKKETVEKEIALVRSIDSRPILVQDSGEGGVWFPTYQMGDYLGISMYRKIWYDFWGVFLGNFIYFKYPLAHWTYKIKANLVKVPMEKIIITELQAEPWGPTISYKLSNEEKDKSMSRNDFMATMSYAQKSGFKDLYLWGVEWWYWEKYYNNNPFYWDTARALFR